MWYVMAKKKGHKSWSALNLANSQLVRNPLNATRFYDNREKYCPEGNLQVVVDRLNKDNPEMEFMLGKDENAWGTGHYCTGTKLSNYVLGCITQETDKYEFNLIQGVGVSDIFTSDFMKLRVKINEKNVMTYHDHNGGTHTLCKIMPDENTVYFIENGEFVKVPYSQTKAKIRNTIHAIKKQLREEAA